MKPKVKLPIWKAYLYSLIHRWRRFLWINKGMLEFGMSKKEIGLLEQMRHKYLRKEVLRRLKALQYHELVEIVLGSKIAIATKEEIMLANKLFISYNINAKEIQMEMKQLKEFAKEVGLDRKAIKGLDEEELTIAILKELDAEKEYSEEFVEWYNNEVPEELADKADALETDEEEKEEEEEENPMEELIEKINDAEDRDELEEILEDEDFEEIFEDVDSDKCKTAKKLKKAMLQAVEDYEPEEEEKEEEKEEKPKGKKDKKNKKEEKEEKPKGKKGRPAKEKEVIEVSEKDKEEIVEAINDAETAEELKEVADDAKEEYPELFKGISFRQGRGKSPYREDVDAIKAEMLERLGEEAEEKEEEEESGEIEITRESVNDALESEDKETLQAMCEELDIELKGLEKRSCKKMASKILAELPEEKSDKRNKKGKKEKEQEEEVAEETEEKKSIYQIVEEMVEEDEDEKEIIKAVTPVLEERGKSKKEIKSWVKQMIAVVEAAA